MSWGEGFVRRFSLASLLAAALIATNSSPAGAAVTVGSTFTPTGDFGGAGVLIQSSSPANSYTVPTNGVITSWSFEAASGVTTPPLKLKIVRPAGGNDFTTIGDTQLETPTPGELDTWSTRISVMAGDLLATYYSNTTFGFRFTLTGSGYNAHEVAGPPGDPGVDPPPGTTLSYSPVSDIQVDVSAVLEPDADQDGFGDETQDQCPTNATTQGPCPQAAPPPACKGNSATIVGTSGNDVRSGTPARDVMVGLEGNDRLSGLAGNDVICGGSGSDSLNGGKGKNTLLGQKGNDKLKGGPGKDKLSGKKGEDTLKGRGGNDNLKGGGGSDICIGGKGNDTASKCEFKGSI
jgi:Ca2+-binding RTX toxin-like protein